MTATQRLLRTTTTIDVGFLRIGGALMLGAAALLPVLPGPDGVPCPLRILTGVPCPLCGMTTSVIAAVHLHPFVAIAASPAGIPAVVVAVWLLVSRRRQFAQVPVWVVSLGLAGMWLWQLFRFNVL